MEHTKRQKAKPLAGSPLTSQTKEVILKFNLPHFQRSDIDINIGKNSIAIRASRKTSKNVKKKEFFHSEKSASSFDYLTSTPLINPKKAKIEFKKGVLKIKAPRV